ncbi:hypothetical protein [Rhodohalobacter sp. SW132]|nr:hypothetical protein [Rhodohalobacter sp. SW132]
MSKMPDRIPARKLSDITLPDDTYNADFQLTDRYQAFSTELIRFSLFGIAGYGFLIANVVVKSDEHLKTFTEQAALLGAGIVFLGLAMALALAYRFFSTGCLAYQISILRTLTRLENPHWTAEELEASEQRLNRERKEQLRTLRFCHRCLMASVASLVGGAVCVVYVFAAVLFGIA